MAMKGESNAPERTKRQARIKEAVTTRILRGREVEEVRPEPGPAQVEEPVTPVKSAEVMTFRTPRPIAKPKPTYREKVEGDKRQFSLF